MDAVITADTDCETALLKINSIAGEWQWIEDEYRWFWDGTELQVNVSLQDIDRIEGMYKIAETADGNKYINFNITDEMEALGYGIVRTASGVYLSERTYNMAKIAVNSEWAGTAEGSTVTVDSYLNPSSKFDYSYGSTAFDSLSGAVATLHAQSGVTDLTLITESDTEIFGGGAIKGFQARFAETKSEVNNLTIGAPSAGDEIGVKWNGSLAYTGNFTIATGATFYVDFRNFNPEQLDTNRVYLMLDGTNATGTISGTGELIFQTDDSSDGNVPSIQGWTIKKTSDSVYFYSDSLDKSSIVINYDWVAHAQKEAKEFVVDGKIYNYGLTAFNGEASATSIASLVKNITYFAEEGSATTSYAAGAIKTNLDYYGFSKVAVTIKTDATMADGTFVIGDNGVTGQTQTFASLHVDEMVTGGAESKTQVDVYYDATKGGEDLFTAGGVSKMSSIRTIVKPGTETGTKTSKITLGEIKGLTTDTEGETAWLKIQTGVVEDTENPGEILDVRGDGVVAADSVVGNIDVEGSLAVSGDIGGDTEYTVESIIVSNDLTVGGDVLDGDKFTVGNNFIVEGDFGGKDIDVVGNFTADTYNGTGRIIADTMTVSGDVELKDYIKLSGSGISSAGSITANITSGTWTEKAIRVAGNLYVDELNIKLNGGTFELGGTDGTYGVFYDGLITVVSDFSFTSSSKATVNVSAKQAKELYKIAKNWDDTTRKDKIKNVTISIVSGEVTQEEYDKYNEAFGGIKGGADIVLSDVDISKVDPANLKDFKGTIKGNSSKNEKLAVPKDGGFDAPDATINMMSGSNTVEVGQDSTLNLGALANVTNLTLKAGKTGETTMKIKEGVTTSAGAGKITVGNNANVTIGANADGVAIGKSDLGGTNALSFGNAVTATISGDITDITSMSIGNDSGFTVKGAISGQNSADKLTIGKGSTVEIGKNTGDGVDLGGGSNTVSVGATSTVEIGGDMKGAATFSMANGTADAGAKVTIHGNYEAASVNNKLTVGNFNEIKIEGDIDNGGLSSGTGTTISVGSCSTFTVGMSTSGGNIQGLAGLTLAAGKDDDRTTATIYGDVTGTAGKNTVSVGAFSELKIHGGLDLKAGANTVTVAVNSTMNVGEGGAGSLKHISTLTLAGGKYDAKAGTDVLATLEVNGNIVGNSGKTTFNFGNYSKVTVTGGILPSEDGSTINLTVGTNADVNIGAGKGDLNSIATLKVANGAKRGTKQSNTLLKAGAVTGTSAKDTVSFGNYNEITLGTFDLRAGDDAFSIGANSKVKTGSIDLGDGKNTFALGASSTLNWDDNSSDSAAPAPASVGDLSGVFKLTMANGGKAADKSQLWTKLGVFRIEGTEYADTISLGSFCSLYATGDIDLTQGETKDKEQKNTMTIGASSHVNAGNITGVTKLALTAGKSGFETELTAGYVTGTDAFADTFSVGNFCDVTLEGLDFGDDPAGLKKANVDALTIGANSEVRITTYLDVDSLDKLTIGKNSTLYLSDSSYTDLEAATDRLKKNKSSFVLGDNVKKI